MKVINLASENIDTLVRLLAVAAIGAFGRGLAGVSQKLLEQVETCDQVGQPVDIGGKLTLHICVPNATSIASVPHPGRYRWHRGGRIRSPPSRCDAMILPLQDMLDIGEGTPQIEARLLAWKRYRVALSRVNEQAGYPVDVDWPVVPESPGQATAASKLS